MRKKIPLLALLALTFACMGFRLTDHPVADGHGVMLDSICIGLHKNFVKGQKAPGYDVTIALLVAKGDDETSRMFNEELCREFFGKQGGADSALSILFGAENAFDQFAAASEAMCRVELSKLDKGLDVALHFCADSIATYYTELLMEDYSPKDRRRMGAEMYDEVMWYYYKMKSAVDTASYAGLAAYSMEIESYTGGAHELYWRSCANLSLSTGQAIRAVDFFKRDKLNEVKQLIRKSIIKQRGFDTEEELQKNHPLDLNSVSVRDNNFLLLRDSVEFVYNPYEIGCFADGFITPRVAYSDLAPYTHQDVLPKK